MGPSPATPHPLQPLLPFASFQAWNRPTGQPRTLPRCHAAFCSVIRTCSSLSARWQVLAADQPRAKSTHGLHGPRERWDARWLCATHRPIVRLDNPPIARRLWLDVPNDLSLSLTLSRDDLLPCPRPSLISYQVFPPLCQRCFSPYRQMWCGLRPGLDGQRVSRSR